MNLTDHAQRGILFFFILFDLHIIKEINYDHYYYNGKYILTDLTVHYDYARYTLYRPTRKESRDSHQYNQLH